MSVHVVVVFTVNRVVFSHYIICCYCFIDENAGILTGVFCVYVPAKHTRLRPSYDDELQFSRHIKRQ